MKWNRDVCIVLTANSLFLVLTISGAGVGWGGGKRGCPIPSRWTKYIPNGILPIFGKKKKSRD